MKLIKLENQKLVVAPELLAIPQFQKIWKRDPSPEKEIAFAELTYIYYMFGFDSPYAKYNFKDRYNVIVENFRLTALHKEWRNLKESYVWKPDKHLLAAIEVFKDLQKTPASEALIGLREGLYSAMEMSELLRSNLDRTLDMHKQIMEMDAEELEEKWEEIPQIDFKTEMGKLTQLLKLANELQKTIGVFDLLYEKAVKQREDSKVFGGQAVGMYED